MVLDRGLAQEVEFLRADLELLRQEVDSMSQCMKARKRLADTMDMILKGMSQTDYLQGSTNTPD